MIGYIGIRLLIAIGVLLGVSVFIFVLLNLAPGTVVDALLPVLAPQWLRDQMAADLGLDKPLYVQYYNWLMQVLRGDLGRSVANVSVTVASELTRAGKNTLILATAAALLALPLGSLLGAVAAFHQGTWVDKLTAGLAMLSVSLPQYWLAIIFISLFSVTWRLFPSSGMYTPGGEGGIQDLLHHGVLPAIALGSVYLGIVARMVRTSILEVRSKEYVTALRAKGLQSHAVMRHIAKNASAPIITVIGLLASYLAGGSVFIEMVFAWPGIGYLVVISVSTRDYPMLVGCILLVATVFVFMNLIVDITCGVIDPRMRRV